MDTIKILAEFDRPFWDYAPSPKFERVRIYGEGERLIKRRGYHPSYMLGMSKVDYYWFADIYDIRERSKEILINGAQEGSLHYTGNMYVDRALHDSVSQLDIELEGFSVIVGPQWICISIIGGTWLGGIFSRRIDKGLQLIKLVSTSLADRYKPRMLDNWLNSSDDQSAISRQ